MNGALIAAVSMMMNSAKRRRQEEEENDRKYQAIREELMEDWDGNEDELNREAEEIFRERYGYDY